MEEEEEDVCDGIALPRSDSITSSVWERIVAVEIRLDTNFKTSQVIIIISVGVKGIAAQGDGEGTCSPLQFCISHFFFLLLKTSACRSHIHIVVFLEYELPSY